jgi:hypothetical protein
MANNEREKYLNQLIKTITNIYWEDYPEKKIVYKGDNITGDTAIFITNNSNRYKIIDLEEEPASES